MLNALLEAAQTIVLPVAVAIITAQVTLRASRQQIMSNSRQDAERREHESELRLRDAETQEHGVRGEVLEQISDAIDDYKRNRQIGAGPVLRAFFRISTRCAADHIADSCRRYIMVAAVEPDPSSLTTAMDDALRRLVGWHLGHLEVWQAEGLIIEATEEVELHIRAVHPVRWRQFAEDYGASTEG